MPFVQSLPGASAALLQAGPQAELIRQQGNIAATQNLAIPSQVALTNAQTGLTNANRTGALAQRAATLFPMADYGRALQEQDFLRRQGVVTTGLTGIPFTPGSSGVQKQSSQPFFNFFGQG